MRNYLLCLLFSAGTFLFGQSPITLSNSNMPGNGDTLRYTNVLPIALGNYTQTGTNFNWNFNNVVSTSEGLRRFINGLLTPYAIFFLSFNEYGEKLADTLGFGLLTATNYYNFYKKATSPNAFIADGAGITFSGVPLPSYYSDKDELYNFPMTYPKYDSTTFRFSTLSSTLIPIRYSKTGHRVTVVDGWGTITTPYGIDNCLRLITTQYAMDSVNTHLGPITIPLGLPNVTRSYQWLTATSKIPYFEVTGTLIGGFFVPTQARYRGHPQLSTGVKQLDYTMGNLSIYPNPATDRLWLQTLDESPISTELVDIQGRILKKGTLGAGTGERCIDISELSPGLYLLKALQGEEVSSIRFIKN